MKRKFKQKMKNFIIWFMTILVALPSLVAGGIFITPKTKASGDSTPPVYSNILPVNNTATTSVNLATTIPEISISIADPDSTIIGTPQLNINSVPVNASWATGKLTYTGSMSFAEGSYLIDSSATSSGGTAIQTWNFKIDDGKPTGTIILTDGSGYAKSTSVNLTLSATDPILADTTAGSGVTQMQFSNDNTTWSTLEAYATTKSWTINSGDGAKTIYVKFKDAAGNVSNAYSVSFTLDTVAPTLPDTTKITVNQNAPGTNDTVSGIAGAVENNAAIKIYSDAALANLITGGTADATGAFSALSIGDNTNADVYLVAVDAAGNISNALHLTNDIVAPTNGSVVINSGATISSGNTVSLALSATGATKMKFSLDNVKWSSPVTYATSLPTADLSDSSIGGASGNGDKTVYVQFLDDALNASSVASAKITVNSGATDIRVANIVSGAQTITPTDDVSFNITATGATSLTKSWYSANPQKVMESGLTAMTGKFLELAIADTSKITWPVEVKIYFTQNNLTDANISSTAQIKGLYFWDASVSQWKLYEGTDGSTGVTTPSDREGYIGFVWAKVNHFTPMAIGLDISAPSMPNSLIATVGDKEIGLSWERVADAGGYYVRYRPITGGEYTTVYLTGVDNVSTKTTGLKNDVEYEFGIAAMDASSNISAYANVNATPKTKEPTPAKPLPSTITSGPAVGGYHPLVEKIVPKAKAAETETPKAEETKTETKNWVRILTSLAVLIIIVGASFAAYSIYEWWFGDKEGKKNNKEENKEEKREKEIETKVNNRKPRKKNGKIKPKKKGVNSRW